MCKQSLVPSLLFKNEFLAVVLKNYAKIDIKVFLVFSKFAWVFYFPKTILHLIEVSCLVNIKPMIYSFRNRSTDLVSKLDGWVLYRWIFARVVIHKKIGFLVSLLLLGNGNFGKCLWVEEGSYNRFWKLRKIMRCFR